MYWDEINQLLNPVEDEMAGTADQELIPGYQVTNAAKLGERNRYENELLGQILPVEENGL